MLWYHVTLTFGLFWSADETIKPLVENKEDDASAASVEAPVDDITRSSSSGSCPV